MSNLDGLLGFFEGTEPHEGWVQEHVREKYRLGHSCRTGWEYHIHKAKYHKKIYTCPTCGRHFGLWLNELGAEAANREHLDINIPAPLKEQLLRFLGKGGNEEWGLERG